jgi:hypothetical protein
MIREHETEPLDVWKRIAAPVDPSDIQWRQDGRPMARDGKFFARFVAYIDASLVRERLDTVVPGEWNLSLELLPSRAIADGDGVDAGDAFAFKARLQIMGVVREDVGMGKDYKQASTDAFKRVAVRFGIGHELYSFGQNWVPMDGDSKFAKPLEDPATVYVRRAAKHADAVAKQELTNTRQGATPFARAAIASDVPPCPKCEGRMWDNRIGKTNPKAPDFKCRDRSCDGVVWPERKTETAPPDDGPPPRADVGEHIPY